MINFLPPKYQKSNALEENSILVSAGILIVLSLFAQVLFMFYQQNKEIEILEEKTQIVKVRLDKVSAELRRLEAIDRKKRELEKEMEMVLRMDNEEVIMLPIFQELRRLVPSSSWLVEFDVRENKKFHFNGIMLRPKQLTKFTNNLKKSRFFDQIYVETINKEDFTNKGYSIRSINYQISGELRKVKGD